MVKGGGRFGRPTNFFGFLFLHPFDHPCHLKSGTPLLGFDVDFKMSTKHVSLSRVFISVSIRFDNKQSVSAIIYLVKIKVYSTPWYLYVLTISFIAWVTSSLVLPPRRNSAVFVFSTFFGARCSKARLPRCVLGRLFRKNDNAAC